MKSSDPPVIVEQEFNVPVSTVWNAITKLEEMTQWFFENIPSFTPEVGFETQFNVKTPERDFLHLWKITEVDPGNKITYDWSYEKYQGRGLVTFELFEDGNGSRLKLTNTVSEDFPDDIPEFRRESCIGGWEYFIQGRLKDYLLGRGE